MIGNTPLFTEKHHAILFAMLSRRAIRCFGEQDGKKAIRLAVRRYGEQRGRRMALRALRDGQPLTLSTYLRYGEWRSVTQEGKSEVTASGSDLVSRVLQCPWNNAWLETDTLHFGRLYCLEIDHALVRGFNPELSILVNQTLSNDGKFCEFVFPESASPTEKALPISSTVMPWEYHCAHLMKCCTEVFGEQFGDQDCQASQLALEDFTERYGKDMVSRIHAYLDTDFNQVSEPKILGRFLPD